MSALRRSNNKWEDVSPSTSPLSTSPKSVDTPGHKRVNSQSHGKRNSLEPTDLSKITDPDPSRVQRSSSYLSLQRLPKGPSDPIPNHDTYSTSAPSVLNQEHSFTLQNSYGPPEEVFKSILITQCIQEDFIGSVSLGAPLPNSLHIGSEESRRLLGDDPMVGPLSRLMKWAREQDADALEVIHIRDWHDSTDLSQREHLNNFGAHCLKDTPGSELVLGLGKDVRANEQFVNVTGFNDFEDTNLNGIIDKIKKEANGRPIRVGVVGVWTEAKVSYLLYELKTRLKLSQLSTCSALTAGSSRLQHFNALTQLEKLLQVVVTNSVAEFTDWLVPRGKRLCDIVNVSTSLQISGIKEESISGEDRKILNYLFRTCSKVHLIPLSGGFSGSLVCKAQSFDSFGHKLAPCVVKIGPRNMIAKEQTNFERVEEILGNNAPRIKGYVDLNERAGIKLAFASMSEENVQNLETVYKSKCTQVRLNQIFTYLFEEILSRFYVVSQYERLKLLECYNFDGKGWAWFKGGSDTPDRVKERVADILQIKDGSSEYLTFPGNVQLRNVAWFLEHDLPTIPKNDMERHNVSYVHGDLHGNNVLIDPNENIWLIDFFFTERTHVLKDIAKVENDLIYIWTDPQTEDELEQGIKIITTLAEVNDLGVSLPEKIEGITAPSMIRAYESIRVLRNITRNIIKQERNPLQMSIVLLRYALHNLCLDSPSRNQRILSLAAACAHGNMIKAKFAKQAGPIIVYWIGTEELKTKGRLGITLVPGRKDKGRNLQADLNTLKNYGVKRLLCLSQQSELDEFEVGNLPAEAIKLGMNLLFSPLKDQTILSFPRLFEDYDWIMEGLNAGEDVVLFCSAGLGRSGTLAACILASCEGVSGEKAIEIVRRDRGTTRAIERKVQENLVHYFAKSWKTMDKKNNKGKSLPNLRFKYESV